MSACYELAAGISQTLRDVTYPGCTASDISTDAPSLGFVDGTENPDEGKAAAFAVIGDGGAVFKGGSYVFVQNTSMICAPGKPCPQRNRRKP